MNEIQHEILIRVHASLQNNKNCTEILYILCAIYKYLIFDKNIFKQNITTLGIHVLSKGYY